MAKKKDNDDDDRLQQVDNPTASFPIGTLGGLEPRQAGPDARRGRESAALDEEGFGESELDALDTSVDAIDVDELTDEDLDESDEGDVSGFWPSVRGGVHPALLVLSLLGGAALALAVVAVMGLFLLLG